tara:strand:+ start:1371 stop:1871 length:501 start_codon:yes stop_codon:yes gene_type:complete
MMRYGLCLAVLVLAGCGNDVSPEEQARRDAQDVAEVRAAQIAPAVPVTLQPIGLAEIEQQDMIGLGCSFLADNGGDEALAITMGDAAFAKRGGQVMRLAPDRGSAENPLGTQAKYDGREFSLQLDVLDPEGEQVGMETMGYDARLTLTDGRDRVLFKADGTARCGA